MKLIAHAAAAAVLLATTAQPPAVAAQPAAAPAQQAAAPAQQASAQGPTLRLLVSNGMKGTMDALQRQCEAETGRRLAIQFSSTAALKQRIESGEAFDLTIITVEAVDDLITKGLLKTPHKAIGRSELGIGIRAGAPRPDIRTVAAFRQALRTASSITYPRDGASRAHIERTFEQLGIAAEVKPKVVLADGAGPATESVAAGKVTMVLTLFSEVVPTPGAEILGPFPGEYQFDIRFAAATSAKSTQAAGAGAVIDCLLGPKAAPVLKAKGISPPDVHVMISAGFHGVYAELGPAFERATGHRLITTRGPSMGDSPEAIPARLARGEAADVVILDGGAAGELAKRGLVRAGSRVDLARSQVGMVVRAGAAKPDISSVEAFRRTLLAAKSIGYSDSGSGTYLSTTLFKKLGVADQVAGKSRKVRGPPSGEPVAAVVARGEVEFGFQQLSELIHAPGVTFVGPLPAELQPGFSFAGAITRAARQPDAALALLRFLSSPDVDSVLRKYGLMPPARR